MLAGLVFSLLVNTGGAFSSTFRHGIRTALNSPPSITSPSRSLTKVFNVWSNPQAVEDYQDLLAGKAEVITTDQPSLIIVGDGYRGLGNLLQSVNPRGDDALLELGPGIEIPRTFPGEDKSVGMEFPVYLCVKAEELPDIIDNRCPPEKKADLVFLSDGFLEPILKARGCCGKEQTQAVLWVSFNQYGVPEDGRTSMGENANGIAEYAGETTVTGKWAGALTERLGYGNLFCRSMFYRDWRRWMLEKVVYGAVFNLVGALHPKQDGSPSSHEDVALYFSDEVDEMISELSYTLRGYMAVTLLLGSTSRLCAYAEANGREMPCEITAESFEIYNKLFWDNAQVARQRNFPDTCAMHTEYLEYGAEKNIFSLPFTPVLP